VEGTVLLDHDDDVLDVGQQRRRGPRGERAGERIDDEAGPQREAGGEELAPGEARIAHSGGGIPVGTGPVERADYVCARYAIMTRSEVGASSCSSVRAKPALRNIRSSSVTV